MGRHAKHHGKQMIMEIDDDAAMYLEDGPEGIPEWKNNLNWGHLHGGWGELHAYNILVASIVRYQIEQDSYDSPEHWISDVLGWIDHAEQESKENGGTVIWT